MKGLALLCSLEMKLKCDSKQRDLSLFLHFGQNLGKNKINIYVLCIIHPVHTLLNWI